MKDFGVSVCADAVGLGKTRLAAAVALLYRQETPTTKIAIKQQYLSNLDGEADSKAVTTPSERLNEIQRRISQTSLADLPAELPPTALRAAISKLDGWKESKDAHLTPFITEAYQASENIYFWKLVSNSHLCPQRRQKPTPRQKYN